MSREEKFWLGQNIWKKYSKNPSLGEECLNEYRALYRYFNIQFSDKNNLMDLDNFWTHMFIS